MSVAVTISGSSPNFNVNYPASPYTKPVNFTNNSSDQCKLWYRVQGGASVLPETINGNGGTFSVDNGVDFAVTATNVTIPPALAHVIHVGS